MKGHIMPGLPSSRLFLDSAGKNFLSLKTNAEKAIVQLDDVQLRTALDANTNSVAVIMKHMAGNMISRWTDLLTTDGEKPDRNRDGEFIDDFAGRSDLLAYWERGWACALESLGGLREDDLTQIITIRGEPHVVIDAIHRQLAHQAYHTGQIIQLARYLAKDRWTTITIPRGGSKQFNDHMGYGKT